MQFDLDSRNDMLAAWVANVGASPWLQFLTGARPANTAAAATGTQVCEIGMGATPFTTPTLGYIEKNGTWSANSVAAGVIAYARILNTARSLCLWQGTVSQAVSYATTAAAAINANVLTFASTAGAVVGAGVAGVGVQPGTKVAALTGATVTLDKVLTAAVLSADAILIGDTSGDIIISGAFISASGVPVTVSRWKLTAPGA